MLMNPEVETDREDLSVPEYADEIKSILDRTVDLLEQSKMQHLERGKKISVLAPSASPSISGMALGGDLHKQEISMAGVIQCAIDRIVGDNPELALETAVRVLSKKSESGDQDVLMLQNELQRLRRHQAA